MAKPILELLLVDVRSAHNVGAILRSADAFGISKVIAAGLTPYPRLPHDERLPHVIEAAERKIAKTALGAERTVPVTHSADPLAAIHQAEAAGRRILVLEQAMGSVPLNEYRLEQNALLVVGAEVGGLPVGILKTAAAILEIPMLGAKESLNVAVATGIALYALRSR